MMHNNKPASRYIIKFLTTKNKVKILAPQSGPKNVHEQKKKKSQIRITLDFSTMTTVTFKMMEQCFLIENCLQLEFYTKPVYKLSQREGQRYFQTF